MRGGEEERSKGENEREGGEEWMRRGREEEIKIGG